MQRKEKFTGRRLLLATTDAVLAGIVAYAVLGGARYEWRVLTIVVMATACVGFTSISGGYVHATRRSHPVHQYSSALAAAFSVFGTAALLRSQHAELRPERSLVAVVLLFGLLTASRVILVDLHRLWIGRRLWVIGEDLGAAHELARKTGNHDGWFEVVRYSAPPRADEITAEHRAFDAVLCTASLRPVLEPACTQLRKELLVVPDASDVLLYTAGAHHMEDLLVLCMRPLQLTAMQKLLKRFTDLLISAVLLVLAAPVMLALYVLVPLESSGPAIFRQERRGEKGQPFYVWKFRTMITGAEAKCGPVLASEEDPRVTRLGKVLRASRLDELPQLINVLRGDMSLVGPRPEREFFAVRFDRELPNYALRTTVKPGLTGLAQVWGSYSTSAEDKLRMDLMYIANYSLALDLQLLLHTARVVLHVRQSRGLDGAAQRRLGLMTGLPMEEGKEA